jgi:hypothetical protein
MQRLAAYHSFTNKLFILCRNSQKSNTLNGKFSDGFHPFVLLNQNKFLFNVKEKNLLYSVMIKYVTRFGLNGHCQAK